MKFYSYDYVLSQISTSNWLLVVLILVLFVAAGLVFFQYYLKQRDSKYRELFIILMVALMVTILIGVTQFQTSQLSDNQYRLSLHFIEVMSEELGVDKSKVYVNTSAATDGTIVMVDDQFYRAIGAGDADTYLLEKIDLYKADVELVEVTK